MTGTAYSARHAEIYDTVHAARGRDWAAEAEEIAGLIQRLRPGARSLLDVACGTGGHLQRFRERFERVEGLELSDGMRQVAARKLPGVTLHGGDMRSFRLAEPVEVITCMCFSISYLPTVDGLCRAVSTMAANLVPGGVVVVEPWWFPENFIDGFVTASVAEGDGRVITRMSHSVGAGRQTRMTVRYTVGDAGGIRDFTEQELLTLFTEQEYLSAFERAGIAARHQPGPPNGRGLFVGIRA
ncbi:MULTISPECIES: class I SAM-dependent DNA methyltransferase [Micromonospora]|uniref:class I SAM-dependent DNA methyltransferase n=1 Tax=Micromonospora TaxID=1873 RepID=UPI0033FAFF2D